MASIDIGNKVGVAPSSRVGADVRVSVGVIVSVVVGVRERLGVDVTVDKGVVVDEGDGALRRVGLGVFVHFTPLDGVGKTSLVRGDGNGEAAGCSHALKDRLKANTAKAAMYILRIGKFSKKCN
jgi:hypothetical protein